MKDKIYNVMCIVFGLFMANAGLDKFLHYMPMPENMSEASMNDYKAYQEISWLFPLIGAAELVGGLMIIFPKTRALGALILFPVMVGILLTNVLVDRMALPIVLVLTGIFISIIVKNKDKYLPILG